MIQRAFTNEIKRRLRTLRDTVVEWVGEDNELGLVANVEKYKFLTTYAKLEEFNKWLQTQIDGKLLSVTTDNWGEKYVNSAYRKGVARAYTDAHRQDLAGPAKGMVDTTQRQFLLDSFAQPETLEKIKFLATRVLEDMKGLGADAKKVVNRTLANGMANGTGPGSIARDMAEQIDGLSRKRALMIARTETIRAHAEGQLDSFEKLGVEELGVEVEWSTAGDDAVCQECQDMAEESPYTIAEARGLLPAHPNCRCSWIPAEQKMTDNAFEFYFNWEESQHPRDSRGRFIGDGSDALDYGVIQGKGWYRVHAALLRDGPHTVESVMAASGMDRKHVVRRLQWMVRHGYARKEGNNFVVLEHPAGWGKIVGPIPPVVEPIKPVAPPVPLPTTQPPVVGDGKTKYATAAAYREQALKATSAYADLLDKQRLVAQAKYDIAHATEQKMHDAWKVLPPDHPHKMSQTILGIDKYRDEATTAYREVRALDDRITKARNDHFLEQLYEKTGSSLSSVVRTGQFKEQTHIDTANQILAMMPKNKFTQDEINALGNVAAHIRGDNGGGKYISSERIIVVGKYADQRTVFAHEYAHHISHQIPDVMDRQNRFYDARTVGEIPGNLPGYFKKFLGKRDKFDNYSVYAGRIYDRNTGYGGRHDYTPEPISVGLEHIFKDPIAAAKKDPEWFDMVVGALKRIPAR